MKNLFPSCINRLVSCLCLALLLGGCANLAERSSGGPAAGEPEKLPRNYVQGLSHLANGDFAAAIPVLQRFITAHPELAGPQLNLGIALRKSGHPDEAMAALQKAVELNPENPAAWQQLGILHRETGQFNAARDAYKKALRIDPKYALAHRNIGILYDLYLQQPGPALQHYNAYLALVEKPDADVGRWIVDLERRSGSSQARTSE